ncbi:serine hydrolase [Hydrobacter penzbergensis]|nr:serine hydrolase [Hydrobacter penzbergensis]
MCNLFLYRQQAVWLFLLLLCPCLVPAQEKTDSWLQQLLNSKAPPLLQKVLNHPDSFQYQLIYTEINRDANNRPHFKNHYLHVDRNRYFNPASTVKLPTALVALEKLHSLRKYGVDRRTHMLTDSSFSSQSAVWSDSSSADGYPSVEHYIKKIFLISDNDAYNRLYEFVGQAALNRTLWSKGYPDIRIVRRFTPMSEEENRHTNSIRFEKNGTLLYQQPAAYSDIPFNYNKQVLVGNSFYDRYDSLIHQPMDFTRHNNFPLEDLQQVLQSVLFPQSVPASKRFHLSDEDEQLLYQYMSEYPSESQHPRYDTTTYFDSYTKFFLFKDGRQKIPSNIRIFNKTGWSYGYLTDAAYIVDFDKKIEFMLSGVIYVNRDGILNDDKYEYEETGYPFFKEVGRIIYEYEQNRKRSHQPNLNKFVLDYNAIP